ncbi:MAG: hypothetical protein KDI44_05130 [Thiothrix sp.]|nr:hypothetical protein [Thiothrix sp.]
MVATTQTPDYQLLAGRIDTHQLWNTAAVRDMQPFALSTFERFMPILAKRCPDYFGDYPVSQRLLDLPGLGDLHSPEHMLRQESPDWELPWDGVRLMRGLMQFLNQVRPVGWLLLQALLQTAETAAAVRPVLLAEREAFLRSAQADWLEQGRHGSVLLALSWHSDQGGKRVVVLDCQFERPTRYDQFPAAKRHALQQLGSAAALEQHAWFFVLGLQERPSVHLLGNHYYRRYWHFAPWPALLQCWETRITRQALRFGTGFARFRRSLWDTITVHSGSPHESHQHS